MRRSRRLSVRRREKLRFAIVWPSRKPVSALKLPMSDLRTSALNQTSHARISTTTVGTVVRHSTTKARRGASGKRRSIRSFRSWPSAKIPSTTLKSPTLAMYLRNSGSIATGSSEPSQMFENPVTRAYPMNSWKKIAQTSASSSTAFSQCRR